VVKNKSSICIAGKQIRLIKDYGSLYQLHVIRKWKWSANHCVHY